MSSSIIRIKGLTSRYRDRQAVNYFSFNVFENRKLGLKGPNRAGKSYFNE